MRTAILALAGLLLAVTVALGQPKPDFTGTWRLDASRSNSAAHGSAPRAVTVEIAQTPAEVRITTTSSEGSGTTSYTIAPSETPSLAATSTTPTARWVGAALQTDAIRNISGQSVTVRETRQLSADGNEMTVDSIVNVQHGYSLAGAQTYGASKDVFVRVR